MKTLTLLMLLSLVSCVGGNGAGSSAESAPAPEVHQDWIINYDSNGAYQITGRSIDLMYAPHLTPNRANRAITIPDSIELIEDSAGSVQNGDVAAIIFGRSECTYQYDGSVFAFQGCDNELNGYTSGNVIYLEDIEFAGSPWNEYVQMGVIRAVGNDHTGIIKLQANLQ